MKCYVVNILDSVEENGEIEIEKDLSLFSCSINKEIEDFVRYKSIDFARRKLSITYLVYDINDSQLLGYFALTHKAIDIKGENLSNTSRRKLSNHARYEEDSDTYSTSAFLLAQFGKNYGVDNGNRISGAELMEYAMDILADIQHRIGGGVVYLDAEDRPALKEFYEKKTYYKFFGERYSESDKIKYLQYMRFL